jgi:predicted transporter
MKSQLSCDPATRSAFSLLDLVMVLGMLFLLAAIFLPAISLAKQKIQAECSVREGSEPPGYGLTQLYLRGRRANVVQGQLVTFRPFRLL